jgi:hypothetical protein
MRNRKALARAVSGTLSLLILGWIYLAPTSVVGQFMRLLKWVVTAAFVLFELAVAAWIFRRVFHETTEQSERRIVSELHWLPEGLLRSLLMVEVRVWLYGLKRSRLSQWEGANFSYAGQGDNAKMQKIFLRMMLADGYRALLPELHHQRFLALDYFFPDAVCHVLDVCRMACHHHAADLDSG